jgi:hypothetical protein
MAEIKIANQQKGFENKKKMKNNWPNGETNVRLKIISMAQIWFSWRFQRNIGEKLGLGLGFVGE